jgi:hypothetical protein
VTLTEDLLPAERRLAKDGWVDLRTGTAEADDAVDGGGWPRERTLRAHVLREFVTESGARMLVVGARITETFDVEGMTVPRSLVFTGCHFDERLNLQDSELVSLRLRGCHLAQGLNAQGCRIRGNLELDRGFHARGTVELVSASVGGRVVATGGRFDSGGIAIDAQGLMVDGDVLFDNAFESDGQVSLRDARILGFLGCSGGRFMNPSRIALNFDRADISGAVFLRNGFHADGTVRMIQARIHGDLDCDGGRFNGSDEAALLGDRMLVAGDMFCRNGFDADGKVRLLAADVKGAFVLLSGTISNPGDLALDLEAARIGGTLFLRPSQPLDGWIDLSETRVGGSLADSPEAWRAGYQLAGCRYPAVHSSWEADNKRRLFRRDTAVTHRLQWLAGNREGYMPQVYDQLIEAYAAAGEESHQRDALIAKQRRRRGQLPWYGWLWNLALDVLIGFGYRTGRALIPFVAFLAFGWWYFGNAYDDGDIIPRSTAETMNVPPFRPLIYSLDQLVPVVNFGQRESWVASGDAQTLVTVMVIVGWVLTTAILAALTGLVRRNQ